jgi:hypothetical protein
MPPREDAPLGPFLDALSLGDLKALSRRIAALGHAGEILLAAGFSPCFDLTPGFAMRITVDAAMPRCDLGGPPPDDGLADWHAAIPVTTTTGAVFTPVAGSDPHDAGRADIPPGGSASPAAAAGVAVPAAAAPPSPPAAPAAGEADPPPAPVPVAAPGEEVHPGEGRDRVSRASTVEPGRPRPERGASPQARSPSPPPGSASALASAAARFARNWDAAEDGRAVKIVAEHLSCGAPMTHACRAAAEALDRSASAVEQRLRKKLLPRVEQVLAALAAADPAPPQADAAESGPPPPPSPLPPEPVQGEPAPAAAVPAAAGDVAGPPRDPGALRRHLLDLPRPSPWTLQADGDLIIRAINGWTAADMAAGIGVTPEEVHARLARLTGLDRETGARRFSRADVAMALAEINAAPGDEAA